MAEYEGELQRQCLYARHFPLKHYRWLLTYHIGTTPNQQSHAHSNQLDDGSTHHVACAPESTPHHCQGMEAGNTLDTIHWKWCKENGIALNSSSHKQSHNHNHNRNKEWNKLRFKRKKFKKKRNATLLRASHYIYLTQHNTPYHTMMNWKNTPSPMSTFLAGTKLDPKLIIAMKPGSKIITLCVRIQTCALRAPLHKQTRALAAYGEWESLTGCVSH